MGVDSGITSAVIPERVSIFFKYPKQTAQAITTGVTSYYSFTEAFLSMSDVTKGEYFVMRPAAAN